MQSYKLIAEKVALKLKQPNNFALIQSMIDSAKAIRAMLLRQDIEKNKTNPQYENNF